MAEASQEVWAFWLKLLLGIATGVGTFVGGIFAAGFATAKKIGEFEKQIAAAALRMDSQDVAIHSMVGQCLDNRISMRKDITLAVTEGMLELNKTWGPELTGAREQRARQSGLLEGLQKAIDNQGGTIEKQNDVIVRLHERVDQDIRERKGGKVH